MFYGNVQYQLMELECAKLETRLAQIKRVPETKRKKSRKTRWDLDGLERETKYLDNLAKKALSPLSLFPSQKPVSYDEGYSHYPKIKEPHRICEKVRFRIIENNPKDKHKSRSKIQVNSRIENIFENSQSVIPQKKHHKKQRSSIKINKIIFFFTFL